MFQLCYRFICGVPIQNSVVVNNEVERSREKNSRSNSTQEIQAEEHSSSHRSHHKHHHHHHEIDDDETEENCLKCSSKCFGNFRFPSIWG